MISLFEHGDLEQMLYGICAVGALFLYGLVRIRVASRSQAAVVAAMPSTDPSVLVTAEQPGELADVAEWLRDEEVGRHSGQVVVSRDPARGLRERLEQRFDRLAQAGVGAALTGVALVITFILIGLVLLADVPSAIRAEEATEGAARLADSVGRMGAKFFISAAGVLLTLLHRLLLARAKSDLHASTERAISTFVRKLSTIDMVRLENEKAMLTALHSLEGRLGGGIDRLSGDVQRLHSMEVIVKDLGSEFSGAMGKLMKDTLADQMKTLMEDMKLSAERIQSDIQSFADAALARTAEVIVKELRSVNETLEKQAGSQVERLLEKLQDVVTGGFASESKNMSTQLAQFGAVIPRLGEQMNGVADRLDGVLQQIAAQQAESARTVAEMATASKSQVAEFSEAFAKSGQEAMGTVLSQAYTGIAGLIESMKAAVVHSQDSSGVVRENLAAAGSSMSEALEETQKAANSIRLQMKELTTSLEAAAKQGQSMDKVAYGLSQAVAGLETTVRRMSEIGTNVAAQLAAQQELQKSQAAMVAEMQRVWPQLLQVVSDRVRDSTQSLGRAWEGAAANLEKATGKYVANFAESVDDLTGAVAELKTVIGPQSRSGR